MDPNLTIGFDKGETSEQETQVTPVDAAQHLGAGLPFVEGHQFSRRQRVDCKELQPDGGLQMLKHLIIVQLLFALIATTGCILRPGMNTECLWPPEDARTLDLTNPDDERHLILDTELIDELVDRHRFNPVDAQQRCDAKLVAEVAQNHGVSPTDVERAREQNAQRGLNLPVVIPVVGLLLYCSHLALRRIERRFAEEPVPRAVSLVVACVAISATFVYVGGFWTSLLQMIRVGSQHVGGRVNKLPWLQHQGAAFLAGVGLFWSVVLLRWLRTTQKGLDEH